MNTLALLVAMTVGQITILPAESDPYTIVEATLTAQIPEGAQVDGGWEIPENVDHREVTPTKLHLTGPPGEYVLKYNGFWIHLGPSITVKDVNGVEHTFQPYLGHGVVNNSGPWKVKGTGPPPPPPPPPNGKYQIMYFIEAGEQLDKYPQGQQDIINSLTFRKHLETLGHTVGVKGCGLVIDDDEIAGGVPPECVPWTEAVQGDPFPRVAIAPVDGGTVTDFPMPDSPEELIKLLANPVEIDLILQTERIEKAWGIK